MSLLVLDPEIATRESLGNQVHEQLTGLGFTTLTNSESTATLEVSRQGNVEVVFCCAFESLPDLSQLPPGVSLVWVCTEQPKADAMLDAMQAGVQDVWFPPFDDAAERVKLMVDRAKRLVDEVDSEASGMRAELERDQRAGQYIQMGMLPPNPMGIGHFRLQHRVVPSLILSGDFVDYFQISDRYFACYVADVAGHGASSAFVTVLLKNFSRRLRREYRVSMLSNPGQILSWINTELIDQGIDKHVAMFFGIVDVQRDLLHYANAAHFPPAVVVSPDGLELLEQKAKPLGLFPGLKFESRTISFSKGSKLVVFSDGVLDLIPADSIEEKEKTLNAAIQATDDMDELWSNFAQDRLGPDDVSCLMVRYAAGA